MEEFMQLVRQYAGDVAWRVTLFVLGLVWLLGFAEAPWQVLLAVGLTAYGFAQSVFFLAGLATASRRK